MGASARFTRGRVGGRAGGRTGGGGGDGAPNGSRAGGCLAASRARARAAVAGSASAVRRGSGREVTRQSQKVRALLHGARLHGRWRRCRPGCHGPTLSPPTASGLGGRRVAGRRRRPPRVGAVPPPSRHTTHTTPVSGPARSPTEPQHEGVLAGHARAASRTNAAVTMGRVTEEGPCGPAGLGGPSQAKTTAAPHHAGPKTGKTSLDGRLVAAGPSISASQWPVKHQIEKVGTHLLGHKQDSSRVFAVWCRKDETRLRTEGPITSRAARWRLIPLGEAASKPPRGSYTAFPSDAQNQPPPSRRGVD